MRFTPLALSAILVTACGFGPADFTVVTTIADHEYTIRLYDHSKLVSGMRESQYATAPDATPDPLAGPNDVAVQWVNGDCKRDPVITVDKASDQISIEVDPDASAAFPPALISSCDAVGVLMAVVVTFAAPVDASKVSIDVKGAQ